MKVVYQAMFFIGVIASIAIMAMTIKESSENPTYEDDPWWVKEEKK